MNINENLKVNLVLHTKVSYRMRAAEDKPEEEKVWF